MNYTSDLEMADREIVFVRLVLPRANDGPHDIFEITVTEAKPGTFHYIEVATALGLCSKTPPSFFERHKMNYSKVQLPDLIFSRRARIRGVTRFSSIALGLVLVFGSTSAFALTGLYDQTGKQTSTTNVDAATAGSYVSQTGFGASDSIQSLAWGEAATGSACPSSPHSAAFTGWKKFINASGWSYVTSASLYLGWQQLLGSPCWIVGSLSSTGDFNVS